MSSFFSTALAVALIFVVHAVSQAEDAVSPKSVSEIHSKSKDWLGKTVTLHGEIDDIEGNHVFEFESEDENFFRDIFSRGSDEILVVSQKPLSEVIPGTILREDMKVTITGKVQAFNNAADLEKQLSLQLGPEAHEEWRRPKTVIVLESVTL